MNARMKALVAAAAVSLGLTALPASAQVLGGARSFGYADRATGYNDDGTLNVFGAHIDPRVARGPGLIGGVTNTVGSVAGGATAAAGTVVGGAVDGADDVTATSLGYRAAPGGYDRRVAY